MTEQTAFLVRVSISQWSPRKLDRKASRAAREEAGASDKAGVKVYKTLMAAEALEAVSSIAGEARAEHRNRTVPWQYDGPGCITADGYQDYVDAMAKYKADFERAVKVFLNCYDSERAAAPANLGALYNEADYPSLAEVAAKFSFETAADPLPQSADFRVAGLTVSQTAAIKARIDANRIAALEAARQSAWDRIVERVEKMQTKLREYKPAEGKNKAEGVFRDSLVSNVQELINVLPSLNVTNDPDLTAIATRLQTELCAFTAAELRESDAARAKVASNAEQMLKDVWAKRRASRTEQATEAQTERALEIMTDLHQAEAEEDDEPPAELFA
jgi:hypothetical protein